MFETLAKLVNADKLRLDFTEYELCDEFKEALDHAQVRHDATAVVRLLYVALNHPAGGAPQCQGHSARD
jgi:hypothetical protein